MEMLIPTRYLKMSCPACGKPYSVDASRIAAGGIALRFECAGVDCRAQFMARAPLSEQDDILETLVITPPKRAAVVPVPAIRHCPKCGARGSMNATDCAACGIVFAKYKPAAELPAGEIRLDDRRDISEFWDRILAKYEDEALHESFVTACYDAGALAFAAQKYSQILAASPREEIARAMRARIIGLASFAAEPRRSARAALFRVPLMNNLVLALSGACITTGAMLPHAKPVSVVGIVTLAFGLGLRYFSRSGD